MKNMRELLAGCLRESAHGYVVDALIENYPSVSELMNAREDEISIIKGIGVVKAKQLKSILEFARRVHEGKNNNKYANNLDLDKFKVLNRLKNEFNLFIVNKYQLDTKNYERKK